MSEPLSVDALLQLTKDALNATNADAEFFAGGGSPPVTLLACELLIAASVRFVAGPPGRFLADLKGGGRHDQTIQRRLQAGLSAWQPRVGEHCFYGVDFAFLSADPEREVAEPFLVAESEATSLAASEGDKLKDYRKLFHFGAPLRVFIGRVASERSGGGTLKRELARDALQNTADAFRRHDRAVRTGDELGVVLLVTNPERKRLVAAASAVAESTSWRFTWKHALENVVADGLGD